MDLIPHQEAVGNGLGHLEPTQTHPTHSRGTSENVPPVKNKHPTQTLSRNRNVWAVATLSVTLPHQLPLSSIYPSLSTHILSCSSVQCNTLITITPIYRKTTTGHRPATNLSNH